MITQEIVRKLFDYNPETGDLIRKITVKYNARAGDIAGYANSRGYLRTAINGKTYRNHRVAFLHHNGYLPKLIDHINGDKLDNRIENLRECTKSQNGQNANICDRNTSGIKGVSWHKKLKKWTAHLSIGGKEKNLGYFTDIKKAEFVVMAARENNHNEFCNHGFDRD